MLKVNKQYEYGNRFELMVKVATGRLFGRIPICPFCKQNKLSLNLEIGEFRCYSGEILKDTCRPCYANFKFEDINLTQWLDLSEEEIELPISSDSN